MASRVGVGLHWALRNLRARMRQGKHSKRFVAASALSRHQPKFGKAATDSLKAVTGVKKKGR